MGDLPYANHEAVCSHNDWKVKYYLVTRVKKDFTKLHRVRSDFYIKVHACTEKAHTQNINSGYVPLDGKISQSFVFFGITFHELSLMKMFYVYD